MADPYRSTANDGEVGTPEVPAPSRSRMEDTFSLKCEPRANGKLSSYAAEFLASANIAIASNESSAIFNAAVDFSEKRVLDAAAVGDLLAELYRHKQVPLLVLRTWLREGRDALGESEIANGPDVVINTRVQEHASQTDWKHADVIRLLGKWQTILNNELFCGKLAPAAISIARSRKDNYGSYLLVRDGLGLRHRINLNELYIARPLAEVLRTLLHEMVHLWEDLVHNRRGGGSYHTKVFCEKAADLGIPVDARGRSLGITPDGRFATVLRGRGVPLDGPPVPNSGPIVPAKGSGSHLAKWSCGCTNVRVSSGVALHALCTACECPFMRCAQGGTQ